MLTSALWPWPRETGPPDRRAPEASPSRCSQFRESKALRASARQRARPTQKDSPRESGPSASASELPRYSQETTKVRCSNSRAPPWLESQGALAQACSISIYGYQGEVSIAISLNSGPHED